MAIPTVLLADPDADSRTVYSLMLEHHGFRVVEARDPSAARRLACEERPDVVVAELFLPFLEGLPLPVLLKREECTAHIPVIGLTALSTAVGAAPGLLACDSHLVKPCTPSRLLHEVRRMLDPSSVLRHPLPVPADG